MRVVAGRVVFRVLQIDATKRAFLFCVVINSEHATYARRRRRRPH